MEAQLQRQRVRANSSLAIAAAFVVAGTLLLGIGYGIGSSVKIQAPPAQAGYEPTTISDDWTPAPSDDYVPVEVAPATRAGDDWAFDSASVGAASREGVQTSHAEAAEGSDNLSADGLPDLFGNGPR